MYNATHRTGALDYGQPGIWLGLNGMAIGGKRRFTIDPKLVSGGVFTIDSQIRHEKLIVEAVLTESCVPILLRAIYLPTESAPIGEWRKSPPSKAAASESPRRTFSVR